jgi:hypothetical protein
MPLRKFRSLQAMEDALWYAPGDAALWPAIRRVWDFAERTVSRRFPPGVHKHRSLEEAQALREAWEEKDFRAFWERQRAAGIDAPWPAPKKQR